MLKNFISLCPMNIEYILMMSFYTLKSIVAFKSENSRKIVRDVPVCTAKLKIGNRTYKYRQWFPIHIYYRNTFHGNIYGLLKWKKKILHCRNNSTIKYQNRRKRSNVYPRYTQINDDSHSWLGIVSAGVTVFTNDSRWWILNFHVLSTSDPHVITSFSSIECRE